jgi:hypothetical protein
MQISQLRPWPISDAIGWCFFVAENGGFHSWENELIYDECVME